MFLKKRTFHRMVRLVVYDACILAFAVGFYFIDVFVIRGLSPGGFLPQETSSSAMLSIWLYGLLSLPLAVCSAYPLENMLTSTQATGYNREGVVQPRVTKSDCPEELEKQFG